MIVFMQFSTKIDGFEQKYSQGFENSYNSHEQYPLEKFFIFTIYQNYTLALIVGFHESTHCERKIRQIINNINKNSLGYAPYFLECKHWRLQRFREEERLFLMSKQSIDCHYWTQTDNKIGQIGLERNTKIKLRDVKITASRKSMKFGRVVHYNKLYFFYVDKKAFRRNVYSFIT